MSSIMGRSPVVVGGQTFASKAALERRCREIVSGYEDGQMMSREHAMFLLDLILRRHDSPAEKIMPGLEGEISGIRVKHDSGYAFYGKSATNVNHTFVVYASGLEIDFSWKKCCAGFKPEAEATQAMRRAVADQVAQYKRLRYANGSGSVTSDVSGKPLAWGDARVDHWPKTFAYLRGCFLSAEGIALADVQTKSGPVCGVAMADEALMQRWQAYHDAAKTLRLVSARENEISWREEGAIRNGI
jgi:hypothetical protein